MRNNIKTEKQKYVQAHHTMKTNSSIGIYESHVKHKSPGTSAFLNRVKAIQILRNEKGNFTDEHRSSPHGKSTKAIHLLIKHEYRPIRSEHTITKESILIQWTESKGEHTRYYYESAVS
jgi:hypothetical protein